MRPTYASRFVAREEAAAAKYAKQATLKLERGVVNAPQQPLRARLPMNAGVPSREAGAAKRGPLGARRAPGASARAAESVARRPNLVDFPSARARVCVYFTANCSPRDVTLSE